MTPYIKFGHVLHNCQIQGKKLHQCSLSQLARGMKQNSTRSIEARDVTLHMAWPFFNRNDGMMLQVWTYGFTLSFVLHMQCPHIPWYHKLFSYLPPPPRLALSVPAASMDTLLRCTKHNGPVGSTSPLYMEGTGFIPHREMCFSLLCWFSRQIQQELRRCIFITLNTSIFHTFLLHDPLHSPTVTEPLS